MKKILKNLSTRSISDVRKELMRAHFIITLLSVVAIVLLILGLNKQAVLDPTLSGICGVLIAIIALISLKTALALRQNK